MQRIFVPQMKSGYPGNIVFSYMLVDFIFLQFIPVNAVFFCWKMKNGIFPMIYYYYEAMLSGHCFYYFVRMEESTCVK